MSTTHDAMGPSEARAEQIREERRQGGRLALAGIRNSIRRRLGIVIDPERLEQAEVDELWKLGEKLLGRQGWEQTDAEPFALSRLSQKERDRFEALVGVAAGEPQLFGRTRDDARLRKRLVELAQRTRPAERVVVKQPGAVALPAALFGRLDLPNPTLNFTDLGILAAVALALENGRSPFYGGRVEGEGDERTLVMPRGATFGYQQDDACQSGTDKSLRRLAEHKLLTLAEQGGEKRIGIGPALRTAWETT